jgi:hypothetical protein
MRKAADRIEPESKPLPVEVRIDPEAAADRLTDVLAELLLERARAAVAQGQSANDKTQVNSDSRK